MELYHGTDNNFSHFDTAKSADSGIYFTTERNAAGWYGERIIGVNLKEDKILDLTSVADCLYILNKYKAVTERLLEEEGADELDEVLNSECEYLNDSIKGFFSDCGMCFEAENGEELFVRDFLLSEIKKEYDCVVFDDYTDGDYHRTFIVFDTDKIEYLN